MRQLFIVLISFLLIQGCSSGQQTDKLELVSTGTIVNVYTVEDKTWVDYEEDPEYRTTEKRFSSFPSENIPVEKGSRIEIWGKLIQKNPDVLKQMVIIVQSSDGTKSMYRYDYEKGFKLER